MKTQLKFLFYTTAAIILLSLLSYTQKKKNTVQPYDIGAAIDAVVEAEMALQDITGVVVGVVQNGVITHTKAYGYKDKLRTQAMSTSTVMRWASISKTVTAVAAFKAIENNKMALTDKVTKHVSYWPVTGNKDDITIAHLLSHRAGIVHYGNDDNGVQICTYKQSAYTANNNFNAEQCVNVFKDCNLAFTPGTNYWYSTFGFNLLGAAVEGATGKAYEIYVDDNIADKAGMSSFTAYSSDPGGFIKDCNAFLKSETEGDVEWKLPGGGWASNINDMADFLKGMVNGTFLNNTAALWTPVAGNSSYCYGIFKETLGSKTHVYHGGAHDDLRSYLGFFPADKTGVCLMINGGVTVDEKRLAKKIENVLGYNWGAGNTNTDLSNAPLDYCGSYNDCGQTMTAVWRNTGKANDVLLRRGYTTDEFHEEWEKLLAAGYYADDIETWLDGLVRKWDGIFKKTTKKSAMWRGYSTDDWHNKWVEMNNDGYRLIDLETYLDGVVRKWAGTFIESTESYYMYRDMTTDDFGDKHTELQNKNIKLIDIETYLDGTVRKWAGVWKGSGSSLLNRNYNEGDFITLRNDREAAGYKLLDVETYMDGTVRKWAGVWESASGDEHFRLDKKMCDLINTYHNVDKLNGYELMDIEKY
jgi:CubicO group peptidase (beta-lactamase class C family)